MSEMKLLEPSETGAGITGIYRAWHGGNTGQGLRREYSPNPYGGYVFYLQSKNTLNTVAAMRTASWRLP